MKSLALSACCSLFIVAGCSTTNIENEKPTKKPLKIVSFEKALLVPVVIDNKKYTFLVDTGATNTILDPDIANQITTELPTSKLSGLYQSKTHSLRAVSGELKQDEFKIYSPITFRLGSKVIHDNEFAVGIELDSFSEAIGVEISGIIGIDTFRQLTWIVDNNEHQFYIYDYAPSVSEFEQCLPYLDTHNWAPEVRLKYEKYDINTIFDTGANHSYIGAELLNILGEDSLYKAPNTVLVSDAISTNETEQYIVKDLFFNNMPLGELAVTVGHGEHYAFGLDFLERFDRYAFIPSKMVFCYDGSSIKNQWSPEVRQIHIRFKYNKVELAFNREQVLQEFGLKNGDVILEVGGKHYRPDEIATIREMLSKIPKGELVFKIQRGNEVKVLEI